jgi:hypothetical protein
MKKAKVPKKKQGFSPLRRVLLSDVRTIPTMKSLDK